MSMINSFTKKTKKHRPKFILLHLLNNNINQIPWLLKILNLIHGLHKSILNQMHTNRKYPLMIIKKTHTQNSMQKHAKTNKNKQKKKGQSINLKNAS